MKAETKETIRWMKERLNYNCVKGTTDEDKLIKAIDLLDSLPKLEARLGRGGYIPDRNGTPCKDGDVVDVIDERDKHVFEGVLRWDKDNKRFGVHYFEENNSKAYYIDSLYKDRIFEKVKNGSNNN